MLLDNRITPRSWPIAIVDEVMHTRTNDQPRSFLHVSLLLPNIFRTMDGKEVATKSTKMDRAAGIA